MWDSDITPQQLAQKIASLEKVCKIPGLATENDAADVESSRYLRPRREKEIADNLAFFSNISGDKRNVAAVGIEEDTDGNGCTFRIAVNTGSVSDLLVGFTGLARILEKSATRESQKADDMDALFSHVTEMDLERILLRLGSCHAKKIMPLRQNSTPLIQQFLAALNQKLEIVRGRPNEKDIEALSFKTQAMQDLFQELEDMPTVRTQSSRPHAISTIKKIVIATSELTEAPHFSSALDECNLEPSLKTKIIDTIGKISRYHSASSELVSAARSKQCRIFEKIQVKSGRIFKPASSQIAGRIHAEIQLLFFYEQHPELQMPRYICASKSACYLCNLFFTLHGSAHVPRTHGKLYPQWVLPYWLKVPADRQKHLSFVLERFTAYLDSKISNLSPDDRRRASANESVVHMPKSWPSTSISAQSDLSADTIRPSQSDPDPQSQHQSPASSTTQGHSKPSSTRAPLPASPLRNETFSPSAADASPATASMVTIEEQELPYSKSVHLRNAEMHFRILNLDLTFDFCRAYHGRLSVKKVLTSVKSQAGFVAVDVEKIPYIDEYKVPCPKGSNELHLFLEGNRKELVEISLVWMSVDVGT
ncbi:hypothetical protein BP5796_13068 [Coleophoma crateriformis]|uniref:Uncharacterized protein n=1 Tax=Coleophoma crateriformis TaxID=565419 RepID=A0A3D8Q431_9HELO|nr:hypothetical protein BP5796_13068 [Coleophoma crateriformis]